MAKPQDSKKAVKKEKTVKVKMAGLSESRVVDSDSESEQKAPKAAAKPVEMTEKKTKVAPKKAATSPLSPPPKKEESSDDEDSDDLDSDDESTASEEDDVGKMLAVNGVKRKAAEASSSSSEEESSSGESLAEVQPAAKKSKTHEAQPKKTKASPPSEGEEAAPPKAAPLSSIPAKSYVAPKDYAPVDSSKSHSLLPSNLQGKQIWHITAPSALPISEIKAVGADAIANGSTVLTYNGSEYSLSQDTFTASTTLSVFLPRKEGYKASDIPVAQSLRLQQKIVLPNLSSKQARTETGSEAAANVWKSSTGEGVRPQPKGMRMRYKPPGFGLGEPGLGSDDDDDGEAFKLSKAKKAKKMRRESGEEMEGVEMTGKELSKEEKKRAKKEAKAKAAAGSQ